MMVRPSFVKLLSAAFDEQPINKSMVMMSSAANVANVSFFMLLLYIVALSD
jgi:hypothetical protein